MKAAIHQPHYFPYPGFFHKLKGVDVFVIMDATQYDRRFTNRNQILDPHGPVWLSVPIDKANKFMANREVMINNNISWRAEHWQKILVSYANAPYFDLYSAELRGFYEREWKSLLELDLETTKKVMTWLGLSTPTVLESTLGVKSMGSQRLVDICQAVDADEYLSGRGGTRYLDEDVFRARGISVEYQNYSAVPYPQRFVADFVPDLSVLDMLFNVGPSSPAYIDRGGAITARHS